MPGLTPHQRMTAAIGLPGREPTPPNATEDAPDLLDRWLACAEAMLALDRVSHTQLETCVIGLGKWCGGRRLGRELDMRAVAMVTKLKTAQEERAWKAKW